MVRGNVLLIDNDPSSRLALAGLLSKTDCNILEAADAEEGMRRIGCDHINVLITELRLPTSDGIEVTKRARTLFPELEAIIVTASASVETAVEALKEGAYDFIRKPAGRSRLVSAVRGALEKQRLRRQRETFANKSPNEPRLIGASPAIQSVLGLAEQASASAATVLITGETGTGKEVLAHLIHRASLRKDQPLVKVNCAALPETLIEAELFGYERGAFTGALAQHSGRFELANGGTLFLDEIGDAPLSVQIKLLRVLQSGQYERLGGTRTLRTDVRVIAATSRNLQEEIAARRFREDLLYRLKVVDIHMPPLRERKEDLEELAHHFVTQYATLNDRVIEGFTADAKAAMSAYDWPGNVRELENAIERAVIFSNKPLIEASLLLPGQLRSEKSKGVTFKIGTSLRQLKDEAIHAALAHSRGNKLVAAELLSVGARTLYRHANRKKTTHPQHPQTARSAAPLHEAALGIAAGGA